MYQLPLSFTKEIRSSSLATQIQVAFLFAYFSPMELVWMYINNLAVYFAYHTTVIYSVLIVCIIFLLVLILKDYLKSKSLVNYSVWIMILCFICATILLRTWNSIITSNLLKQEQEEKYKTQTIACLKSFSSGIAIKWPDDLCLGFYKKFIWEMEKKKAIKSEITEINKKINEYSHYCDGVDLLWVENDEKKESCIEYVLFSSSL